MQLANIAFPWLWPHWRLALLLLTACMLAESLLVRPLVSITYLKALAVTAAVNVLSTAVGWPLRWLLDRMVFDVADVPWKYAGEIIYPGLFVLTVLVEWPLFLRFLRVPAGKAFLISIVVNSVSYHLIEFSLGTVYMTARP